MIQPERDSALVSFYVMSFADTNFEQVPQLTPEFLFKAREQMLLTGNALRL